MLHNEETGSGEPLVMVHGAWADGRHWTRLADELADAFRVIVYDRRGHGRSAGRHEGVARDVRDLVDLFEYLGTPGHVVAGSFGGTVALWLAAARPDLLLSLSVHEPALAGLLGRAPQPPDSAPTPQQFAESSLGAGAWEWLTEDERDGFRDNAEAWLDELSDANGSTVDADALGAFDRPVLITIGGESPEFWHEIAAILEDALPRATTETIPGAAHLPHLTHAREYGEALRRFVSAAAAPR